MYESYDVKDAVESGLTNRQLALILANENFKDDNSSISWKMNQIKDMADQFVQWLDNAE